MKKKILVVLGCLLVLILVCAFVFSNRIKKFDSENIDNSESVSKSIDTSEYLKPEQIQDIYENELEISTVTILTPTDEVLKVLGEPIEKKREIQPSRHQPDTHLFYIDTWIYEKIELVFLTVASKDEPAPEIPEKLFYIYTTDENYPTARGIRVGDSVEKIFEKYGSVEPQNGYYCYGVDFEGYEYMVFKVENDKITEIQYRAEPD